MKLDRIFASNAKMNNRKMILSMLCGGVDKDFLLTGNIKAGEFALTIRRLQDEVNRLNSLLIDIGDFAHDKSTGPAVPDALWEIRAMAYQQ